MNPATLPHINDRLMRIKDRLLSLTQTIRELHAEKQRLDHVIAALETLQRIAESGPLRSRRGRKSVSPAERREASARMTAYWAKKRGRKTPPNSAAPSNGSRSA